MHDHVERGEVLDPPNYVSKREKLLGAALFAGLFVVWPTANVVTAVIGYKTIAKQVELEQLKQAAAQITQS